MKKIAIPIVVLLMFAQLIDEPTSSFGNDGGYVFTKKASPFTGEWQWEKNDAHKDFSITIKEKNGYLVGDYCCVMQNGDKVDCSDDKDNVSFKTAIPAHSTIVVKFRSSFSETEGEAQIVFDGQNLLWHITKQPSGEYYCPADAKLIRKKGK
jgi:hypothetical protein